MNIYIYRGRVLVNPEEVHILRIPLSTVRRWLVKGSVLIGSRYEEARWSAERWN